MVIVKNILIVLYFINCFSLIILAMMQTKEDAGVSSVITGSSTNNFYEKNKGRTREGRQKRWTIILGTSFAVLTIILSIIYVV